MPEHPVLTTAARFRAQVLGREREAANRLVQTYGRAYTRLSPAIEALSQRIARMDAPGPSKSSLVRLESLRSLQSQVVSELNTFSTYADAEISRAATAAIQSGLLDSRALSVAVMGGTGPGARALAAGWDMLPTESVETMLGFLADESPLHTALVKKLGPAVAQRMSDALVDGIALGMNPRKVADIVRRELGVGLTWALTTARTAQINAYREAARANYVANGHIIGGWTWLSALGNRTCVSCLNMHGSFHPVTESLTDHHAGRCVPIPYVKQAAAFGLPQPEIEPGEQWFRRQPQDFQRQRLGPGRFDAWKAGKFDFRDLSQPYNDPVYGEMLREATLKGLLTGKAKGRTLTFGTPAPERVGVAQIPALGGVAGRTAVPTFKTTKEAAQWITDNGYSKAADFGKLDLSVAQDMAESVAYHTERFPKLKGYLDFYGSAQARNKTVQEMARQRIEDSARELYKKIFPDRPAEWVEEQMQAHVKERLSKLTGRVPGNAYALAYQKELVLNEKFSKNAATARELLRRDVEAGFHPVGCDTAKSVIDHEFGHILDNAYGSLKDFGVQGNWREFDRIVVENGGIKNAVSGYAATNGELWAEAWSEYLNNPTPRPVSKFLGDWFLEYVKGRP